MRTDDQAPREPDDRGSEVVAHALLLTVAAGGVVAASRLAEVVVSGMQQLIDALG
jgi:hypothetical protein